LVQATVECTPLAANTFDIVTCFDVLYHQRVGDDVAALREFSRILKPGGWLLLRVPAHNWLHGAHDKRVHTRQRYGRAEVRDKLTRAGFRVERLTSAGLLLLPTAVLRRWLQPRQSAQSDLHLPTAALNSLLTAMLTMEAAWLRRHSLPVGLSLFAAARSEVL
jgi:SAM-dependent methyltransferase